MTQQRKYIYAVDFDGTLITGNKWPDIDGQFNTHLANILIHERARGNKVILWTNRHGEALEDALWLCDLYNLQFDAVNENIPETIRFYGSDPRKITYDYLIDDRAINPATGYPVTINWQLIDEYNIPLVKAFNTSFVSD